MYCFHCGTQLVQQPHEGRQRPTCPMCGHVAYQQLKVGAGVLVEREGTLLLVQRSPQSDAFPGTWNLPAGYCEADEPPAVTAAREAVEETGLRVQLGRLVDAYFFDDDPRGNGVLLVYEARIANDDEAPVAFEPDNREVTTACFFPADHLPAPLCGGGHDRAIKAWQARTLDRWQPGMPLRYCPHCSHPLEDRLAFGRVRLACAACGFVHFREAKVGISVLVEHHGQVLLVQRANDPGRGLWCLPSGFLDWDEAPESAAAREVLEETGLVVTDLALLEVHQYTDDFRGPGISVVYRGRVGPARLQPGDDALVARWYAPDKLPVQEAIAFHNHQRLLEWWRKMSTDLAAQDGCARMSSMPPQEKESDRGGKRIPRKGMA